MTVIIKIFIDFKRLNTQMLFEMHDEIEGEEFFFQFIVLDVSPFEQHF